MEGSMEGSMEGDGRFDGRFDGMFDGPLPSPAVLYTVEADVAMVNSQQSLAQRHTCVRMHLESMEGSMEGSTECSTEVSMEGSVEDSIEGVPCRSGAHVCRCVSRVDGISGCNSGCMTRMLAGVYIMACIVMLCIWLWHI